MNFSDEEKKTSTPVLARLGAALKSLKRREAFQKIFKALNPPCRKPLKSFGIQIGDTYVPSTGIDFGLQRARCSSWAAASAMLELNRIRQRETSGLDSLIGGKL